MNTLKHLPVVVLIVTCLGCGDGRVAVEGNVSFDGRPVEQGTIVFEPADGKGPSTGGQIAEGKYRLIGDGSAVPGKKIVRITAVRKTGRKIPAGPPEPPDKMVDELERYIPAIFNTDSTLTCEIEPGQTNQHDFELNRP